jgi:hypothetical protein
MGLLGKGQMSSPQQSHEVHIATDLLWITGEMETMGSPHNYINQDGMDFIHVDNPHIAPWSFSGLPSSHAPSIMIVRERTQFLMFIHEASLGEFRAAPRVEMLILHLPLAIIHGKAPFLSEAKFQNFLDFWKGIFVPIIDADVYYLADSSSQLLARSPLVYINRYILQSYIEG